MSITPRTVAAIVAGALAVLVLLDHADVARALVLLAVAVIVCAVGLIV